MAGLGKILETQQLPRVVAIQPVREPVGARLAVVHVRKRPVLAANEDVERINVGKELVGQIPTGRHRVVQVLVPGDNVRAQPLVPSGRQVEAGAQELVPPLVVQLLQVVLVLLVKGVRVDLAVLDGRADLLLGRQVRADEVQRVQSPVVAERVHLQEELLRQAYGVVGAAVPRHDTDVVMLVLREGLDEAGQEAQEVLLDGQVLHVIALAVAETEVFVVHVEKVGLGGVPVAVGLRLRLALHGAGARRAKDIFCDGDGCLAAEDKDERDLVLVDIGLKVPEEG